ncbi:MAG TPA: hypothetical protein VMF87_17380 [Streptosporangiaceae bacterium]|nr:hypothetical protein [Streptosporangiaceae bacterium]
MNRSTRYARRCAAPAFTLAIAGLALAGCGGSPGSASGSSGSSGSAGSGGKPAATSSSTSSAANSSASTTTGYANWPIGVGDTWQYQNSLGGTVTNKMTAVVPVSGGQQVTQSDTVDLAGSPTTTNGTFIFHSDGSITYPADAFGNGVSLQGTIGLPAPGVLASGQPTKSVVHITMDQGGQQLNETAHITVRGAGSASVTVPAGSYQTQIVEMMMAFKVSNIPLSIEVRTWLANGVGPVQSEAITFDGGASHVTDEQKLTSFTKG